MKKFVLLALVLTAVAMPMTASAVGGKLKCFSGTPATCTIERSSNAGTLDTRAGGYAGVYLSNGKSLNGAPLASVDFTFNYYCSNYPPADTTDCVNGGSPRWSIPIDENGDGEYDGYAFIDAAGCGQMGQLTGVVSTEDTTCQVTYKAGTYANWDAFAAANPTYTIAKALPFVIADQRFYGLIGGVEATEA